MGLSTELRDTPCPRCGCFLVRTFCCGCGAHDELICSNCARAQSLPPHEHVELSPFDIRCTMGARPHHHAYEDRLARFLTAMNVTVARTRAGAPS
jgi:hypothetical protein